MCGHVGLAGKLEYKDESTLKRLLVLDYFRGTDSTGVAAIRKNDDVLIAKIASHPIDLFDTKSYEKINNAFQTKAFIGHNRAATKGKVNSHNAHPYHYGHIIGAHNGTLENSSWKALNEVLGYETDTDSMAVFACIEKIGIEETAKLMAGAWALVWIDMNEKTLNFLRNKERPMWYAYDKDFKKLFWASEWPMIQAATAMSSKGDYDLFADDGNFTYFPMEVDYLYSYDLDKLAAGGYDSLPDVKGEKLEGKAPTPVVSQSYRGGSPFFGGTTKTGTKDGGTKTSTSGDTRGNSHLPPFITVITGDDKPLGSFLTVDEFNQMTGGKCMYCSDPIEAADEGIVVFEGMNEALCGDCSGHTTSRFMATPITYSKYLSKKENVK